MTAADEAKQLDSVTDMVQEKEMDESKAKDAMSALSTKTTDVKSMSSDETKIAVSKEDVDVIVSELEVTEEVAIKALREAAAKNSRNEETKETVLQTALRILIVS